MALNLGEMRQQMGEMVEALRKKQDEVDERGKETAEETAWFQEMNSKITAIEHRINREKDIQEREAAMAKSNQVARLSVASTIPSWVEQAIT